MATKAVGLNVTSTTIGAEGFRGVQGVAQPINGATTVADQAAVEAAVAVLEADGASPTQGHVNSLRTVWNALVLDIAARPAYRDVVLVYDTTAVGNRSVLKRATAQLLDAVAATNDFSV